jgi:hypothetical protein
MKDRKIIGSGAEGEIISTGENPPKSNYVLKISHDPTTRHPGFYKERPSEYYSEIKEIVNDLIQKGVNIPKLINFRLIDDAKYGGKRTILKLERIEIVNIRTETDHLAVAANPSELLKISNVLNSLEDSVWIKLWLDVWELSNSELILDTYFQANNINLAKKINKEGQESLEFYIFDVYEKENDSSELPFSEEISVIEKPSSSYNKVIQVMESYFKLPIKHTINILKNPELKNSLKEGYLKLSETFVRTYSKFMENFDEKS